MSLLNDTSSSNYVRGGRLAAGLVTAALLVHAAPARAADRIYFSATDNVTNVLIQKINAETVRIDMSCWYLTEHAISIALMNRFKAGVPVRLIGDRGSIFEIDPITKSEFYWLANQGLPIRLRFNPTWFPEIDHMKMTLFVGQNLVSFGSANYTPFELAPTSATNYKDETVLVTDDSAIVNAFKTRFDQLWNDTMPEPTSVIPQAPYFKNFHEACTAEPTGNCADFATRYPNPAPMIINTNRLEPDYPTPPDLIWGQGPQFNNPLVQEINNEPALVQFVIYRLTVDNITQALLNKWRSGVPVQLLIEPTEYMNRKWPEFWLTHANIDKLWAAGVPIKQRAHEGLTHMKTLVTSTYATNASSNFSSGWQRDDNYFIPRSVKPALWQAVKDRVTAMWNSSTAFTPFQPQPPDAPILSSPANGSTKVPTNAALIWNAGAFAVSYDLYLGTSPSSLSLVANVQAQLVDNPPSQYGWQGNLPGGTTIFWKIVARTNATVVNPSLVASSPTWSFTTAAGSAGPPPPAMPVLALDRPGGGSRLGRTFIASGWALDLAAWTGTGVDTVHMWAFPTAGGAGLFLGAATYGQSRPDVGAAYGSRFTNSGFQLSASRVPPGNYTISAYMHSTYTGTFNAMQSATNVTIQNSFPVGNLDNPHAGSGLARPFGMSGWAADTSATSGTGVDAVHLWAFPVRGGSPVFLGAASYGASRPDVRSYLGSSQFTNSGWSLQVNSSNLRTPGPYDITAYGHSTVTGSFNVLGTVRVTVSSPQLNIDGPGPGSSTARPFGMSGWAVDAGASSGAGIDAIHVWAFPVSGAPPLFVGVASYGWSRPDVASYLGSSQFTNSGWSLLVNSSNLPVAGTYDLCVYGRSTVTGMFSAVGIVRVTIG
jgi:phospholipase D-like protein